MSRSRVIVGMLSIIAAASIVDAAWADDVRHFSFAYDQPHTTAYGVAGDTFAAKLAELSHGTMVADQFPGAQLGQEPQVLQKLRTGDVDFSIVSTANSATLQSAVLGSTSVSGPGQKASASLKAVASKQAICRAAAISATWAIRGLKEGRPLAS